MSEVCYKYKKKLPHKEVCSILSMFIKSPLSVVILTHVFSLITNSRQKDSSCFAAGRDFYAFVMTWRSKSIKILPWIISMTVYSLILVICTIWWMCSNNIIHFCTSCECLSISRARCRFPHRGPVTAACSCSDFKLRRTEEQRQPEHFSWNDNLLLVKLKQREIFSSGTWGGDTHSPSKRSVL